MLTQMQLPEVLIWAISSPRLSVIYVNLEGPSVLQGHENRNPNELSARNCA